MAKHVWTCKQEYAESNIAIIKRLSFIRPDTLKVKPDKIRGWIKISVLGVKGRNKAGN